MKGFADQFFGILDTNGVKVEDLKNGSRGIASYFNKLQSGKLDDSVRNVTVEKCLDCPDEWVEKNLPHTQRYPRSGRKRTDSSAE